MSTSAPLQRISKVLLILGALFALAPFTSSAAALVVGALLALALGQPWPRQVQTWTHRLLPLSVVGLGADMDLRAVARAGQHGLGYTALSIAIVLALGWSLARLLKVPRDTGLLISVGTAICGGSAIAAVAPVLRSKEHEISVALATVFLLNAVALVIFPAIGHATGLGQEAFGLWSALAIHDTSSVVGAGLAYGPRALEVATTVKLARALWIVPLTLGIGWLAARRGEANPDAPPVKRPWFIVGFLVAAALVTFIPSLRASGHVVAFAARRALVLTLFLIGASLSREALREVGPRPFFQGLLLWLMAGSLGWGAVKLGLLAVGPLPVR
ncbi:YeiH family protein [Geothrix sp. PMB-07]|uniref:YeiH family protein n=1 Tax=Geothrix sp. PMB-07 TaxID=3068640 RepID=UPI00274078C9|nr:putative sulfate exporter family transporter [Geothrix sp. PMB-07]WLT32056.1 putative sulfate exporter family transporter [Geothrix sp. PMB-07]